MSQTWLERRQTDKLITSASQIETKRLCLRKWWLEKVRRLIQAQRGFLTFGCVLHDVCERYLLADDLGRDTNGNAVELFPEGWQCPTNRFNDEPLGCITPNEAVMIQNMISAAIEAGVLERRKDREVEWNFDEPILQVGSVVACMMGFIDVLYPDVIEDHKTSKNKRYFKSKAKLQTNPQMLIYAKMALRKKKRDGIAPPPYLTLRHNQYCKDPNNQVVRKTEVPVTVSVIDSHWEEVLRDVAEMIHVRNRVNHWWEIPDPIKGDQACNAYGGCPYRSICGGMESVESYETRLANHSTPQYTLNPSTVPLTLGLTTGTTLERSFEMMTFDEKIAAGKSQMQQGQQPVPQQPVGQMPGQPIPQQPAHPLPPAQPASQVMPPQPAQQPPAGAAVNPPPVATPSQATATEPAFLQDPDCQLPPWVNPQDLTTINFGCGFNEQGQPDPVSVMKATQQSLPLPQSFTMFNNNDGTISWAGLDGSPAAGMVGKSRYAQGSPVIVQQSVQSAPSQPQTSPAGLQAPGGTEVVPPPAQPQGQPPQAGAQPAPAGRPKKGMTLCINCVPQNSERKGSGRHVYDLHQELHELQGAMSAQNDGVDFHSMNAFERRDAIAKSAPYLVEKFGNDTAFATGVGFGESDLKELVNALKPFAGQIVIATV